MSTQMQAAREGKITDAMKIVAEAEKISAEEIRSGVASGVRRACVRKSMQISERRAPSQTLSPNF